MRKITKKVLAVFLSVSMAVCAVAMPVSAADLTEKTDEKTTQKAEYVEGEVIAVLKETAPKNYLKASKAVANFGKGISMNNSFTYNKKGGDIRAVVLKSLTKSTKTMIKELRKNEQVKYAFPNYKVKASDITNDTYSSYQWALENNGLNGGTENFDTNPEAMWEAADSSEKEQVVAIVDTGIDFEHEDLKDVLWTNPYGSKLVGKHGYDFSGTIKDHTPLDDNGHGTHVAGIIAGTADNEKGISGINKSNVKIMACKFLDEDGDGTTEGAFAAYEYISRAIELGTNVVAVNNSWGGVGDIYEQQLFDSIFDSLGEKGAITTVAAGNECADLSNFGEDDSMFFFYDEEFVISPASSKSKYCLTVAATNEKDELADFSNYSTEYVDIAAPGCNILSTVSYDCFNPSIYSDAKKAEVVSQMQDYEGAFDSESFGYPIFFPAVNDNNDLYESLGKVDPEISLSTDGFLNSSKSLNVKFTEDIEEDGAAVYAFEIPFTIEDENKPYSISYMLKANKEMMGYIYDLPADYDFAKNYGDLFSEDIIMAGEDGNYWDHFIHDIDPSGKFYEKKMKSKNRKLVFLVASYEKDSVLELDDLAISNQSVDSASFDKYDFYNGTSMATPYVTGAVALVHNAIPDADTTEVINVIKNTGRMSEKLEGKTENKRVLSLENTEKTPPMITGAKLNDSGDVEVKGLFKNETTFKINGKDVTPKSLSDKAAVFADDSYNTKKCTIEAQNIYGSDSASLLLSNKPSPELSPKVSGVPLMNYSAGYYMPQGAKSIPAGDKSYFVSEMGEIGSIYYDEIDEGYLYDDMIPQINIMSLFKNPKTVSIKDAVYLNGKIYFTAVNEVNSDYTGTILGYDSAFGYIDIATGDTKVLCESPDSSMLGSSLAVYNGAIYLIGGYEVQDAEFSSDVYKYNTTEKKFDKTGYSLPEGRAFTRFLQFGSTLVGVYGSIESGELPKIIKFDGSTWSTSAIEAESDDFDFCYIEDKTINVYFGNVGYSGSGLYLNGAYIYGYGDTYSYSVSSDKLTASKYSFSNEIGEKKLFATTLPGAFIGYPVLNDDDDDFAINYSTSGLLDDDDDEDFSVAYCYSLKNSYAKLDDSALNHAKISSEHFDNYAYGDKLTVKVSPESGYVINSISVNGTKLAAGVTKTTVTFNKSAVKITASTKKVAPNKVTGVKVKFDSKKKNYTVSWKKPTRAQGYQVQTYVNKKWKTLKTVKSANTLKYTVKKSDKTGKKFRVRAYSKYNNKTYYGAWSTAVTAK